MRRSRDETKEADRNEKMRIVQMQNLLEQNAQEEKFMMSQARDELKRHWSEEVARKRLLKDATPFLFDEQKCGPASAQVFNGFDEEQREAKARLQQVQYTPYHHIILPHDTLSTHILIIYLLYQSYSLVFFNQQREMKTLVEEALIEQKQKQKAEKEEDVSSLTYIPCHFCCNSTLPYHHNPSTNTKVTTDPLVQFIDYQYHSYGMLRY